MPDRILSEQEVEAMRGKAADDLGVMYADDVLALAASHEALRAEVAVLRDCAGFSYADEAQRLAAITKSIHGICLDAGLCGREDSTDVLPMVEELAARLDEYREAVREWAEAHSKWDGSSVTHARVRRAEAALRALAERDRATESP